MVLEWLRRQDPVLDQHLRTYLFTSGSIIRGGGGCRRRARLKTAGRSASGA